MIDTCINTATPINPSIKRMTANVESLTMLLTAKSLLMTDTSRDCAAAGLTFVNFLFDGRAAFEVGIARYRSSRACLPHYKSQNARRGMRS